MGIFDVLKKPLSSTLNTGSQASSDSPYSSKLFTQQKPTPVKVDLKSSLKGFGNTALDILRTPIRSVVSASSLIGGNPDATITPKTKAEKIIFGEEPIKSYATKIREKETKLVDAGHSPAFAKIITAPIIAAGTVLDVFAEGGAEKKVVSNLVKETSETEVRRLLSQGTKFAPEVVDTITPQIAKATTREEVDTILKTAKDMKPLETVPGLDNHLKDTNTILKEPINTAHLNISDEARATVNRVAEEVRPRMEASTGERLTNAETLDMAERTSKIFTRAVDRETTLEYQAALTRTRQRVAQAAQTGKVDKEFIDDLIALKTAGTDAGRKLQSFSIGVDPVDITGKQAILEAVLHTNKNIDEIVKAAEGVDFTNLEEATNFYRQFVKPKTSEWIDLLRYNSMLSSPKTHIVNALGGNIPNTLIAAPIEKVIAGGVDFLGSKILGRERKMFAGEAGAYVRHYFDNVKGAVNRFSDVMKGTRVYTNLDTRNLPVAVSGFKGKVASGLSLPMRLLEASDQFFSALAESAERGALEYRASKGVNVGNIATEAEKSAAYRLFREQPGGDHQGMVLDAIDRFSNVVQKLRTSENPIVSNIAKWTVPFLRTPTNILKQGIEYSPLGFTTVAGALNKTEQIAKATMGTLVAATAGTLLASNRMTWSEPIDPTLKAAFRAAGMQPYSIKIGDKWVSYQKLPPFLAFPMAMIASLDDLVKSKKMDETTADLVLGYFAKYGQFMADQSYVKSLGDLLGSFKGDKENISRLVSNYPQQLIPYRALDGWLARLVDDTQRKVDTKAGFIEKQMQLMMTNIPILSRKVAPRLDTEGNPIPNSNRFLNAFSPVNITTEDKEKAARFEKILTLKKINSEETKASKDAKAEAEALDAELQSMSKTEAFKKEMQTKRDNPTLYERLKDVRKDRELGLSQEEQSLKNLTTVNRAQYIKEQLVGMTVKEQLTYKANLRKKKILTANVQKELTRLNFKNND